MATTATSARAKTRSQSGITKPRQVEVAEPTEPKKTTKKKTTAKANTSKPRAKTVASGRVEKKPATKKTPTKKAPVKKAAKKVEQKVNGAVEKVEGKVEGKPGKKVRKYLLLCVLIYSRILTIHQCIGSRHRKSERYKSAKAKGHQEGISGF
jgi:hypothetical protein